MATEERVPHPRNGECLSLVEFSPGRLAFIRPDKPTEAVPIVLGSILRLTGMSEEVRSRFKLRESTIADVVELGPVSIRLSFGSVNECQLTELNPGITAEVLHWGDSEFRAAHCEQA